MSGANRYRRRHTALSAIAVTVVVVGTLCAHSSHALTLTVGTVEGLPEDTVAAPVALTSTGTPPSTLVFDVVYSPLDLTFVWADAGDMAIEADKDVTSELVATGRVRTIVSGLNRNAMADGDVATLHFIVRGPTSWRELPLAFGGGSAADPDAQALAVTMADGGVVAPGSQLPAAGLMGVVGLAAALGGAMARRIRAARGPVCARRTGRDRPERAV